MKAIPLLLLALLFSTSAQAEETSSEIFLYCEGEKYDLETEKTEVFSTVFRITEKGRNNNAEWAEWKAEEGGFAIYVTLNTNLHINPLTIKARYSDELGSLNRHFKDEIDRKNGIYSSNLLIVSRSGSTGGHKINAQCEPTTEPQPEKAKF